MSGPDPIPEGRERRYRALVRSPEGVYADARVSFHQRGRR